MKRTIIPIKKKKPAFKRKEKKRREYKRTKKQTAFCHEYVIDHNGTQSAIRAGYSPQTAGSISSQLLKKLSIQEYIQELEDARNEKLELSAERILQEINRLALFDPQKLYDKDGNLIPIHKLDKDTAVCIGGIDVYQKYAGTDKVPINEVTKKFKIWDKNSALEKMTKYFSKQLESNNEDELPQKKKIFFRTVDASKPNKPEDKE